MYDTKKLLVTGANGLVGQKVLKQLQFLDKFQVHANGHKPLQHNYINANLFTVADLADEAQVKALLDATQPDVIVNTAAIANIDKCEQHPRDCGLNNVKPVKNLLKLSDKNTFFIQLSSDMIFDGTNTPYTENDVPKPLNVFGESKLDAEMLVKESDKPYAIVRAALLFGTTVVAQKPNFVLSVLDKLRHAQKIEIANDQYRTPSWADDVARAILHIATKQKEGVFNISGNEFLSLYDLAIRVAKFWQLNFNLITETTTDALKLPAKRPKKTSLVTEKAFLHLGFKPNTLDEAFANMKAEMQE